MPGVRAMSEKTNPRREYRRIYRNVLITLLLLAVTPLVALGWFSINRIDSVYDEKISAGLEALTSSKRRALDTFLGERISQIRTLAFTHSYEELSNPGRLSSIFSVLQTNGRSFVDIGVINLEGRHEAYVGPYNLLNADYHDAEWFSEVLHRGTYVSNVFLGKRNLPHFIIAVLRHDGTHSFILRATIDTEAILSLLQRIYSGSRADAFLMTRDGILQTDSIYYGKAMSKVNFGEVLGPGERDSIALRTLKTADTQQKGSGSLLAAFTPLENMPWVLVVLDDVRQSLTPLRTLKIFILGFVIVGLVLVTAGAVLSTRKLVKSIEEKDRQQDNIDARLLQSSKMAALGKMASGVAHEVNNPLMLIQENAGWISDLLSDEDRSKMKNYDEILASCDKISANVQRARGITQRMLGFGRRMNPGRAEVMLSVVADHVEELLHSEATSHNVRIIKKYSSDVPVILSDPAQLEQVILNIIDNAIDAIGQNGTVTVATGRTPNGGASIAISDTGPGLDEETKSKIFDPFFTTKPLGKGTGLGLAICYNILEKLGGRIDVQGEVGKGTTFTIFMPPEPPQQSLMKNSLSDNESHDKA